MLDKKKKERVWNSFLGHYFNLIIFFRLKFLGNKFFVVPTKKICRYARKKKKTLISVCNCNKILKIFSFIDNIGSFSKFLTLRKLMQFFLSHKKIISHLLLSAEI